jgi:predicted MFS family arabinose efflux permease
MSSRVCRSRGKSLGSPECRDVPIAGQVVAERTRPIGPGWVLFAVLFAAQSSILVLSPILPQVAAEFDISSAAAAQLRSISGVTAGVAALGLRCHRKRVSVVIAALRRPRAAGGASLASAWAPTFAVLVVAHVFIGCGLAAVLSGGLAASESWAADGESRRVLSLALVGQPVA